MNDTTAFLSGCAIAAVATFVILDRGDPLGQGQNACPNPTGNNIPSVTQTLPNPLPPPSSINQPPQFESQLQLQQTENTQLKSQLEQQETQMQQLKSQLDKQWMETQQLLLQLQAQQAKPTTADSFLPDSRTLVLWVIGASVLVLGIGGSIIIVVVILAMFSQSQQRYQPTTHVVHPINVSSSPRRIYERQPRYLSPYAKVRSTSADYDDV